MRKAASLLLLLLLIVGACTTAPAPEVIPTLAVLPTTTDTPTNAPTSTDMPLPSVTNIPLPTDTALPTSTPLPSNTPLSTSTPFPTDAPSATPLPPTLTAPPTSTGTPLPTATLPAKPLGDASVTMTSTRLIDLFEDPRLDATSLQALAPGTSLFLIGRSWDEQWYQVRMMNGVEGWVDALNLVVWIDPSRLLVTANEPTEVPTLNFGQFALGGHVMNMDGEAFSLAHRSGMTWIKVQHRYYVGQSAAEVSGEIQSAHQNGFRILVGVVGDRAQMGNFDGYIANYAAFVADLAALGADAIEVWNEPNIDREWPSGMIYGGVYTQLLAGAYTAIKQRAPSTVVISAAPAPTGFFAGDGCDTGGCNDDIFLKQMAFAGAQNYLDCVGLHHNDGIVSPLMTTGDPRGNYPTNYLTGVMSRVPPQFNGKPLCFTEVGYLSPEGYGGLPGNFAWAQNTTVANQSEWLSEAVQVARASGRVEMMIVWNVDFNVYTPSDPMAGYAILRPGGGCPACDALAAVAGG